VKNKTRIVVIVVNNAIEGLAPDLLNQGSTKLNPLAVEINLKNW